MIEGDFLSKININRRSFLLGSFKIGLFGCLISRALFLQLFKHNKYKLLSDRNRINLIPIYPKRGVIYDSSNILIADNILSFKILIDKTSINYKNSLEYFFKILKIKSNDKIKILNLVKNHNNKKPITLLNNVSFKEISLLEEYHDKMPAIYVDFSYSRKYPFNYITSHLTGYTSRVKVTKNNNNYNIVDQDSNSGKSGLEKQYDNILSGMIGYKYMEVNAYGNHVRDIKKDNPENGQDIKLNINLDIQKYIDDLFENDKGSAILMESYSGKVISMVSKPTYNPDIFQNNLDYKNWEKLKNDLSYPMINRAIHSLYPSGSVFKIITVLAALEKGIDPSLVMSCSGKPMFKKQFNCWNRYGHGQLNMKQAIEKSCNEYIFNLAKIIGHEAIIEMAYKFKLNEKSFIDLPGELSGFIPNSNWKKSKFNTRWSIGDTLNLSIGQGFLQTTPIKLLQMINVIATKGKLIKPLVNSNEKLHQEDILLKNNSINILRESLYMAVNSKSGTAYKNRLINDNFKMSGKTGSAQVVSKSNFNQDLNLISDKNKRNHSIFIGFAPYINTKYSLMVFVENAGAGGGRATSIASKILDYVLTKI